MPQHRHDLLGHQLPCRGNCLRGVAMIIDGEERHLLAQQATTFVELLRRELIAFRNASTEKVNSPVNDPGKPIRMSARAAWAPPRTASVRAARMMARTCIVPLPDGPARQHALARGGRQRACRRCAYQGAQEPRTACLHCAMLRSKEIERRPLCPALSPPLARPSRQPRRQLHS